MIFILSLLLIHFLHLLPRLPLSSSYLRLVNHPDERAEEDLVGMVSLQALGPPLQGQSRWTRSFLLPREVRRERSALVFLILCRILISFLSPFSFSFSCRIPLFPVYPFSVLIGATVVICRTDKGYLFGGYTTATWDQSNLWKTDASSSIFTLANPNAIPPTKLTVAQPTYATFCYSNRGPSFGYNHDICLFYGSGTGYCESGSYSSNVVGSSQFVSSNGSGTQSFTIQDLEVFAVSQ